MTVLKEKTEPQRQLKEMLFEFVRAIEDGEMAMEDANYGGVALSNGENEPPKMAYLRLSFEDPTTPEAQAEEAKDEESILQWEAYSDRCFVSQAPLFGSIRVESWGDRGIFNVNWSVPGYSAALIDHDFPNAQRAMNAAEEYVKNSVPRHRSP